MNWIMEPWPWYAAGPLIVLVMSLLAYFEKSIGVSANLRSMFSIAEAGRVADFFKFNWRSQIWNLVFVLGAVIGGFIIHNYMTTNHNIELNLKTLTSLEELRIIEIYEPYATNDLFGKEVLSSWKG